MPREPDRARYRSYARGAEGTIQLDCAACHRLDRQASGPPSLSGSGPTGGAYMIPVTYENHCRACHRLDHDPATPSLEMAHSLQPAEGPKSPWRTCGAEFLGPGPPLP